MKRRNFLKNGSLAAASVAFMPSSQLFAKSASGNAVKIGIIGVGLRGQNHLELLLTRKDVEVTAICDISEYVAKCKTGSYKVWQKNANYLYWRC